MHRKRIPHHAAGGVDLAVDFAFDVPPLDEVLGMLPVLLALLFGVFDAFGEVDLQVASFERGVFGEEFLDCGGFGGFDWGRLVSEVICGGIWRACLFDLLVWRCCRTFGMVCSRRNDRLSLR